MTDNLRIWSQVSKTNPAHTKRVNQRGGFTAISASYQVMRATEVFGPIGVGWGYTTGAPIITDTLMTVPVTLWHGDRANAFGPMLGCEEWKDKNGRVDSDAPKKAVTDGLTKLLSQLGFNADVFLGLFDDSKYVAAMEREFATPEEPPKPPTLADRADKFEVVLKAQKTAANLKKAWDLGSGLCAELDDKDPERLATITTLYETRRDELETNPFTEQKAA